MQPAPTDDGNQTVRVCAQATKTMHPSSLLLLLLGCDGHPAVRRLLVLPPNKVLLDPGHLYSLRLYPPGEADGFQLYQRLLHVLVPHDVVLVAVAPHFFAGLVESSVGLLRRVRGP